MTPLDSSDSRVTSAVGRTTVGAAVLARTELARVDYVDHFSLSPVDGAAATPEQWARVMFGDIPSLVERLIWQGLLQLRLTRAPSPSVVAGWPIAARGDDWVRLEARSWALEANLVVRASDSEVSLSTMMRYDHALGGAVWRVLSAVHRRLAPGLLRDAAGAVQDQAAVVSGES